jgi:hypothetical protein
MPEARDEGRGGGTSVTELLGTSQGRDFSRGWTLPKSIGCEEPLDDGETRIGENDFACGESAPEAPK